MDGLFHMLDLFSTSCAAGDLKSSDRIPAVTLEVLSGEL